LIGKGAVQIGPGYDDSPVPGRTTPTRDRLGGGFYAASWLLALQAQPRLVIIETWNELHEGTGICDTLEDGRFYIDLTRRYSDMLKAGRAAGAGDWAAAVRALLQAHPSNREGREFASRLSLEFRVEGGRPVEQGLRLCRGVEDGVYEITQVDGTACVQTRPGVGDNRYLYFDIADPYYYDQKGTIRIRVTYHDVGREVIDIHYDSAEDTGSLADRYKPHFQTSRRTDTHTWKTAELTLTNARCANGQNGGADFRFASSGADLAIASVEISKLPEDYCD
jgi:hypothetical protein